MRINAFVGSGAWWAICPSSGGEVESLFPVHRRRRAAMIPFRRLGHARCPMCSLQNSNLHLAVGCMHWEIQEAREDALQQMDTAMLQWEGNGISESWAEAWPRCLIRALIRAEHPPGNHYMWGLVSTALRAA